MTASSKGRARVVGYGFGPEASWRVQDLVLEPGSVWFELAGPGTRLTVNIPRPGRHIASNAAGALALLAEMGHDPQKAAAGLRDFHGVRRRFEHRGTVAGVTMIDDYAHHPTEVETMVKVALAAGHEGWWRCFNPISTPGPNSSFASLVWLSQPPTVLWSPTSMPPGKPRFPG